MKTNTTKSTAKKTATKAAKKPHKRTQQPTVAIDVMLRPEDLAEIERYAGDGDLIIDVIALTLAELGTGGFDSPRISKLLRPDKLETSLLWDFCTNDSKGLTACLPLKVHLFEWEDAVKSAAEFRLTPGEWFGTLIMVGLMISRNHEALAETQRGCLFGILADAMALKLISFDGYRQDIFQPLSSHE